MTKKINLKKLDKTNCQKLRFDEIAKSITERVDPNNTELKIYIGLEHLDPESIHIKRNGTRDDVKGQKLKCYPGDVIFGKRRAYQRKAAIVTQEGFCSAHSMVLRANPEVIEPKLFPFFLHSDQFMNRGIDISVGSLSPTINWGTLKKQEFLLPPKEQQAKLAELLWAMDEVIEKELLVLNKLETLLNSYIKQILTSHIKNEEKETIKVKSLFQTKWEQRSYPIGWKNILLKNAIQNTQNGFAEGKRDKNGVPQLRMNNVTRSSRIDLSSVAMIPSRKNINNYLINENDVMFCNTNSEDLVGKSIIADIQLKNFSFSNHFTRLRPKKNILLPKFLYIWLKYHFDIGLFESRCTRWIGQAAVQTESLLRLYIILPTVEEQKFVSEYVINLEKKIDQVFSKIEISKSLQKHLINKVF